MRKLLYFSPLFMALVACVGTGPEDGSSSQSLQSISSVSNSSAISVSSVPAGPSFRWERAFGINVGGDEFVSASGYMYQKDKDFVGGDLSSTVDKIANTSDDTLYQTERYGNYSYQLPVTAGRYRVTLKTVEIYATTNGARVFSASIEGQPVISSMDLHASFGHDVAHDFESPVIQVNDGNITIEVSASVDNGTLSAIEVFREVEVTAGENPGSVSTGKGIYTAQCESCHGVSGEGAGAFPALTLPSCKTCSSHTELAAKIESSMPLGATLCEGDCADDVAAYILATFKEDGGPVGACTVQEADIRRLTRFEFSNTLYDLLGDDTRPGNLLPSEQLGNGFGNEASSMAVSTLLAEKYLAVAEAAGDRAVNNNNQWQKLHSCVQSVNSSNETQCADQIIDRLLNRAFRRPPTSQETSVYRGLRNTIASGATFKQSIAGVIAAVLQSPEFLYRVEKGETDPATNRLRPTAYEMATRLSYMFWGSMPDDALFAAAANGSLNSKATVLEQANRLLNDDRSRRMVEFFFDNYLPISSLSALERDSNEFPTFNSQIGSFMRQETQEFLKYLIFQGEGDWPTALTANYTFMNQPLAEFYGVSGVFGDEFRKVDLDTNERLGFLTHAGVMAGTTHSGKTNPVTRGAYVMKKLLCVDIPLPTGDIADQIKPPDPTSGLTARERYTAHSSDPVCRNCHKLMDPVGLVFENYDPVGLYRTHENNVLIDASGELPGPGIPVNNALQLVSALAEDERTSQCFAYNWANFAYGKTIGASESCIKNDIETLFEDSNYNVKSLLLNLTQTDAFLYLPSDHRQ